MEYFNFSASTWHVYPLEPEYVGHNAIAYIVQARLERWTLPLR
jgi:hypothetical protein